MMLPQKSQGFLGILGLMNGCFEVGLQHSADGRMVWSAVTYVNYSRAASTRVTAYRVHLVPVFLVEAVGLPTVEASHPLVAAVKTTPKQSETRIIKAANPCCFIIVSGDCKRGLIKPLVATVKFWRGNYSHFHFAYGSMAGSRKNCDGFAFGHGNDLTV